MLHTLEVGDPSAPSLVLLHGGGLSGRQWQPQLERLEGFHLLVPDLPEQGRSAHLRPFTLEGAAEAVAELIAARAKGGRAHLVGLSLGGAVGLTLLRTRPELVESLLVSGTSARLGRLLGAIALGSAGLYRLLPPARLAELSVRQFGIPPEHAPTFREDLAIGATEAFARSSTRALMGLEVPERATSPVLVVVGERETLVARRAARTLVRSIEGARGLVVPGAGHVWNLEQPDLFSSLVSAWCRGGELPAGLRPLV